MKIQAVLPCRLAHVSPIHTPMHVPCMKMDPFLEWTLERSCTPVGIISVASFGLAIHLSSHVDGLIHLSASVN